MKPLSESTRDAGENLTSLAGVIAELSMLEFPPAFCRKVVQLGRDELGFERMGAWFYDWEKDILAGSFGTDSFGLIRDERSVSFSLKESGSVSGLQGKGIDILRDYFSSALGEGEKKGRRVAVFEGPAYEWETGIPLGETVNLVAVMRAGTNVVGFLIVDNLFSRELYSDDQLNILALYGACIGPMAARIRVVDALGQTKPDPETNAGAPVSEPVADGTGDAGAAQGGRETDSCLASIWKNSIDGMRLTDREGTILAVNAAYCDLVGMRESELVARPFTVVYADSRRNTVRRKEYARNFSATARARRIERRIELRSGKQLDVEATFSLISDESAGPKLLTVFRDIATRRNEEKQRLELERRMLDMQKLEGLSVLAGGIAHDFNNLLTGILGNANLAMTAAGEASPLRGYLDNIEVASLEAAKLCKKMLAYAGEESLELRRVDLNAVLRHMNHLLRLSVRRDIELHLHLAESLPRVNAEVSQIEQILVNLVANAAEAIEGCGTITISTGIHELTRARLKNMAFPSELRPGKTVFVEVKDSGSGMEAATLGRVFDPFFTTKFTGRGLGLSAVQGIVQAHKGGCELISVPGRGTAFRILLPADDEAAESALPAEKTAGPSWKLGALVLLLDSRDSVRCITHHMLEKLGFVVLSAADGEEGIGIFRNRYREIDAVLMEMSIPGKDGEEVLCAMREIDPNARILLASDYSPQEMSNRLFHEHPDGFLQKPFTLETLKERMGALFSGGK